MTERRDEPRWLLAAISAAAAFTAGVHLYLAATPLSGDAMLRLGFLAAALGYVGTAAVLVAPIPALGVLRSLAALALGGVSVATIAGYFVVVGPVFTPLAVADKLVEAVLVVLVAGDIAITRRAGRAARTSDQTGRELRRAA
jgi:hypothetical protein